MVLGTALGIGAATLGGTALGSTLGGGGGFNVASPKTDTRNFDFETTKTSKTITNAPQESKLNIFAPQVSKVTRSPNTRVSSSANPRQEPKSEPTVIPIQRDTLTNPQANQSAGGSDGGLTSDIPGLLVLGGIGFLGWQLIQNL